MKKLRLVTIIAVVVLSVLLVSSCAKQKYQKLSFEWADKDIKAISLRKEMNDYEITDKDDIKRLVDYITDADVISKKEYGITLGWTYAIKVILENGEYYWVTLNDSSARWDIDRETQIICTVETDYFKPLIEILDKI